MNNEYVNSGISKLLSMTLGSTGSISGGSFQIHFSPEPFEI